MPGKDDRAGAPGARTAAGNAQAPGGSSVDISRSRGGNEANKLLSETGRAGGERGAAEAHREDQPGRTALGKQTLVGVDQHDAGTRGRPFQPSTILRAPSSLLSHPLFLHPVPPLRAPFRAPSLPPPLAAPLLFGPPAGAPLPPSSAEGAAQSQTPDVPQTTQPAAEVPSPKVQLSVTSTAIDTVPTSVEAASSASTVSAATSPESAIANTTSASAPDIIPLAFTTGQPVAASLVDTSFTSPGTSDILPVTNTDVGVGGKIAAACVIGAVFLLLLNWAFWLVIRRRRRARRSMPAQWDFAAPPPEGKGDAGRESEEDERDAKGGMGTVPV